MKTGQEGSQEKFQKLNSSVAQFSDGRKGRYSLFLLLFTAGVSD